MSEQAQTEHAHTQPSEAELRAYEEELSRITSTQLVVQAAASLLNVGGRRLGLAEGASHERDLEQVRDAIDAVMGLLPIVERRMPPAQARPLRDALAQLQMAYARVAQPEAGVAQPGAAGAAQPQRQTAAATQPEAAGAQPQGEAAEKAAAEPTNVDGTDSAPGGPGPAERSGRLWVPGR